MRDREIATLQDGAHGVGTILYGHGHLPLLQHSRALLAEQYQSVGAAAARLKRGLVQVEHDALRPPKGNDARQHETCWRVIDGASSRLMICAIYQTTTSSLELRIGYPADHVLRSEAVADRESARKLAADWLGSARAAGSFAGLIQER